MNNELENIEILSNNCDVLLEFVSKNICEIKKFNYDDHFSFMGLCFLTKQTGHLRSIRVLLNSEQYSDTMILARIMVEGLGILEYALRNPDQQIALKWRSFSVILDYRLLLEMKKSRLEISKDEEDTILDDVVNSGVLFLKKKNIKLSKSELLLSDPFTNSWLVDNDQKEIKKSFCLKNIPTKLADLYSELSGWVHWDTKSFGQNEKINWSSFNNLKISANSLGDSRLSLASGFLSLYGMIEILNYHFKLNFNNILNEIKSKFESDLNIIKATK